MSGIVSDIVFKQGVYVVHIGNRHACANRVVMNRILAWYGKESPESLIGTRVRFEITGKKILRECNEIYSVSQNT